MAVSALPFETLDSGLDGWMTTETTARRWDGIEDGRT
jgi:hypothetical protein